MLVVGMLLGGLLSALVLIALMNPSNAYDKGYEDATDFLRQIQLKR